MPRVVPHNNIIALAVAPSVWLIYFALTYLVTEIGCARGWSDSSYFGLDVLQTLLWAIAVIGACFLAYATREAWKNLQAAKDPEATPDAEVRERRTFLAKAGFFLCGISLLGTSWGVFNNVIFSSCQS
jgi:heme/copper-type cytochrome/quinol oxidase subunit 2